LNHGLTILDVIGEFLWCQIIVSKRVSEGSFRSSVKGRYADGIQYEIIIGLTQKGASVSFLLIQYLLIWAQFVIKIGRINFDFAVEFRVSLEVPSCGVFIVFPQSVGGEMNLQRLEMFLITGSAQKAARSILD
jgi:hypothetical protein